MKLGVCFVCAAAALLAQQPAPTQPFRAGINLVEVDAVVRDGAGKVIRDLGQTDFEVSEDGRPVTIEAFTPVHLSDPPAPEPAPPLDRSGSAIGTNDYPEDGRVYLLVLDDFHIRFDGRRMTNTKAIARRFIERLAPGDLMAMVSTSSQRDMSVEFTSDRARLLDALDNFFPSDEAPVVSSVERTGSRQSPGGSSSTAIASLKARFALDRLRGTAVALSRVQHRRKSVVLISEGYPFGIDEMMNTGASGTDIFLGAMREFVQAAQRSNVTVYALDPSGLDVERDTQRQDSLRSLSEGTGGFATLDTNDFRPAIDRVIEETGTYYLIGYASPAKPNDGKHHRITVRVKRPGLQVSAREGYIATRTKAGEPPSATPSLNDLIGATFQTRGLPLRVIAVPTPSAKGTSLAIAVEAPTSAFAGKGLELVVTAVDLDSGKVKATDSVESKMNEGKTPAGLWARIASRLDVTPGRYQVRVAARRVGEPEQGSTFAEIVVTKFDGDLALGGLFLGTRGDRGALHPEKISSLLPAIPLAVRDLPVNLPVVAGLPIKVARKHADEVLTLRTILIRSDASTQEVERVTKPASAFAAAAGDVHVVALPFNDLAGPYRLRIEASLPNRQPMFRELGFTVVR